LFLIGIDTGGTFTDFIYQDGNSWKVYKILSTPSNPAEAILNGIAHIAGRRDVRVVHGSTVATNAILERKGAVTALITNKGFEDVIEIGRQNRHNLYKLFYRKPAPLVPQQLRFGVNCRINSDGTILQEPDDEDLNEILKKIEASGAESVAVSFLFSFKNPAHELNIRTTLSKIGIPVSLSHEILAEFREFERTSTTIINAYVLPKMKAYLNRITTHTGANRLRIMQSNGGSILAQTAIQEPVRTILSGPAGGVVGAFETGRAAGHNKLISFDMGGTSTDVALIDGRLPLTMESYIDQYPVKTPMIDIHTVGAGGGSIAFIDQGGSLRVGPESAGADPGPICYGKGQRITVTDANLFLGRLLPENFLGRKMRLYPERLNAVFESMAKDIELSPIELAEGILDVANASMERAIRVISVEKGHDPREFKLFAFGGAGGLHAVFLARLLNIPQVIIPQNPGILSATGMLLADVVRDFSRTVMIDNYDGNIKDLKKIFLPLEKQGMAALALEGIPKEKTILERYLDMRYKGQSYEIMTPFGENFVEEFHGLHEKFYGYCNKNKMIEIVTIRLRVRGSAEKPQFYKSVKMPSEISSKARLYDKKAVFDGKETSIKIIQRDRLLSGNIIKGPALLTEYSSTIIIPPNASGQVDDYGNILITV
jgi:N-methylhydantoinase A